jgi:Rieske Fe-S protein
MFIGGGMLMGDFIGCSTDMVYKTSVQNNTLNVPVSLFSKSNFQIVQPGDFGYNLALTRKPDGSFSALVLRCTHADNPLTATGKAYRCSLHGSTFDLDGDVTHGPAQFALQRLKTELSGDTISVFLPNDPRR